MTEEIKKMNITKSDIEKKKNDTKIFANRVSFLLQNLIQSFLSINDKSDQLLNNFESLNKPIISIDYYVNRILWYSGCTKDNVIEAIILIDRIINKYPEINISDKNIHRLFLACILVCVKMYEDHFYKNTYYAQVGGISVQEINFLEISLLKLLHCDLFITDELFQQYSDKI